MPFRRLFGRLLVRLSVRLLAAAAWLKGDDEYGLVLARTSQSLRRVWG